MLYHLIMVVGLHTCRSMVFCFSFLLSDLQPSADVALGTPAQRTLALTLLRLKVVLTPSISYFRLSVDSGRHHYVSYTHYDSYTILLVLPRAEVGPTVWLPVYHRLWDSSVDLCLIKVTSFWETFSLCLKIVIATKCTSKTFPYEIQILHHFSIVSIPALTFIYLLFFVCWTE